MQNRPPSSRAKQVLKPRLPLRMIAKHNGLCEQSRENRDGEPKRPPWSKILKQGVVLDVFDEGKSDRGPTTTKLVLSNGNTTRADESREEAPTGSITSRASTPRKVIYAEACELPSPNEEKALLATANYNVYENIRVKSQLMTSVKCVIDTSAGPTLVKNCFLNHTCIGRDKQKRFLKIRIPNRHPSRSE